MVKPVLVFYDKNNAILLDIIFVSKNPEMHDIKNFDLPDNTYDMLITCSISISMCEHELRLLIYRSFKHVNLEGFQEMYGDNLEELLTFLNTT